MSDLSQISEDITNKSEQQQEETLFTNDESKIISISDKEATTSENHPKENESESKESVKTTEDEYSDKSNSEYEDVEDEESDEINDASALTSISNKNSLKTTTDEDELHINVKPRRINKKRQDDEHSEGYEDENDNQNVPNTKKKIIRDVKKSDTTKKLLDDDNNTQSPAYIPRKGKFYEHDDRTLDENDQSKQELSRNEYRFYTDSDTKWQHDLYLEDKKISKSQRPLQRHARGHFDRSHDGNRHQVHLNEYTSRSQKGYDSYQEQRHYNNYRRQVPNETSKKPHSDPITSFDLKDYDRQLSYNRDTNIRKEAQTTPRRERRDYDPFQVDERTFHRRRNFTNSQFQQQDNVVKVNNNNPNRSDQRRLGEQSNESHKFQGNNEYHNHGRKNQQQQNRDLKRNELYENKNNLPPRLQMNNNNQNMIQKQQYQHNLSSNLSSDISTTERPKRYSSMRNTMTNSIQQQTLPSQLQRYQDQRSKNVEQNEWPQAPPPPTSYLPQQIITPQMFYQQQSSRFLPMNYSQTSIYQKLQENK